MNCCCTDGGDERRRAPAVSSSSSASSQDAPPDRPPGVGAASWLRRAVAFIQWTLPITTLALIPKCPACVAGYVLLFTGVGLSFSAAAAVRWALIGLSVAALGWLVWRAARRTIAILPR